MRKEHAMAIFIGLLMVLSVAGFALSGIQFNPVSKPADVPTIVNQQLTRDQFRSILLSGKTIIQHHYLLGCAECEQMKAELDSFANGLAGFVVLEEFSVQFQNETKLQMISSDGRITELNESSLEQASLLDRLCEISYVQPKQCLLRNI